MKMSPPNIIRMPCGLIPAACLLLLGCRPVSPAPPHQRAVAPSGQVSPGAAAESWRYPGSKTVTGGTVRGLLHDVVSTPDEFERVWEFYARKVGYAGPMKEDVNVNESVCAKGPCIVYSVHNDFRPGLFQAGFGYRDGRVVVSVQITRMAPEPETRIQLMVATL